MIAQQDSTVQVTGTNAGVVILVRIPVANRQLAALVLMENMCRGRRLQNAHVVRRARLRTVRVALVRILVGNVVQDDTLQHAPDYACPALMESIQVQIQPLLVRNAMTVRQTPIRLRGAQL